MKKLMNKPQDFVNESLDGIVKAHPDYYRFCNGDVRAVGSSLPKKPGKVAIVTGGGYGHLPLFLGYVGKGLCDGVAVGNVFTSPSCESILNVSREVNSDGGILYLFGNYTGDGMNFSMAKEMLSFEGIRAEIITGADDVASAPRDQWTTRRGIAGIMFAYKIAGACADEMKSLDEVMDTVNHVMENVATFGVAFSACTLPEVGKPAFEFSDDEMEIGMGIHGEPGVERGTMKTSREIAEALTQKLLEDISVKEGDRVAVLINGLGSTSREELYIFYHDVEPILREKGVQVCKTYVGEIATSMEMAGASLSILKLDDELLGYLEKPAVSPLQISFAEGENMAEYKIENVKEALLRIASVMKSQKDTLTEIDSKNGDGDLGISMEKGAAAIESTVEACASEDIGALLSQCGAAFNRSAPSTLGTLIGMSFMFLGKEWAGKTSLCEQDIIAMPGIVRDTIARMGKANPGDKTILDALDPFARVLPEEYRNTADLAGAWNRAAEEARAGMDATRNMKAKVGRARWLGDRATGTADGGALLCSLIIDAFIM